MHRKSLLILAVFSSLLLPVAAVAVTIPDIVSRVSQTDYAAFLDGSLYTHSGDNRGNGARARSGENEHLQRVSEPRAEPHARSVHVQLVHLLQRRGYSARKGESQSGLPCRQHTSIL